MRRELIESGQSAGFVGREAALANDAGSKADAVILIDGLHAPRSDRAAFEAQLAELFSRGERYRKP